MEKLLKVLPHLPPPDELNILPNKIIKTPQRRKRHKSDDTDFLLQPIDISLTWDNRPQSALASDPRKEEYDDIDGYRMYKYRPKEAPKICGKYPPSSDPEYELLHFSAILAKHGISYNMFDEKDQSTQKDAADRILDAMDQQLGDFTFPRASTQDVNDDPGTDLESVRSLRDRVMSDLAATNQRDTTKEPQTITRDSHENSKERTHYRRRSSSTSRFKQGGKISDGSISNDLPIATQKALASSLDRLNISSDTTHQPSISSARVSSNFRRGRDHERLSDRQRTAASQISWGTPSTLSVHDLADSSSKFISLSRSCTSSTKESPFRAPKWKEPAAQYHRRSASTKCYSTPNTTEMSEKRSSGDTPKTSVKDEKYYQRVDYCDSPYESGKRLPHRTCTNDHVTKSQRVLIPKKATEHADEVKPIFNDQTGIEIIKSNVSKEDRQQIVHQLSTPEKRDQYEWRMRKMLTELKMPENQIVGLFENDIKSTSNNESNEAIQNSSKSEHVKKDIQKAAEIEKITANEEHNAENHLSHPALSNLYSKTDYHEVPKFAISNESGKTSSVSTIQRDCEVEGNATHSNDENNPTIPTREISTNDPTSPIHSNNNVVKHVHRDSNHSSSTITPSNSNSSSYKDDNIRTVSSHGTFPSHSEQSSTSNNDIVNLKANVMIGDHMPDFEDGDAHKRSSDSQDSRQRSRSPMRDSISSAHSDNTLVAVNSDVMDESSEEINDANVMVESSQEIHDANNDDRTDVGVEDLVAHESPPLSSQSTQIGLITTSKENCYEKQEPRVTERRISFENTKSLTPGFTPDKRRLSYRDRMKIALSARQRRLDRAFPSRNAKEPFTPKRRHSLGSDSLTTIATDDLIAANPCGNNFTHNLPSNSKGGRSNLPRSSSVTSLSTVHTEEYEDKYKQMLVRHLAGVPVTSFDGVTIASDLDSVNTDAVRDHFKESLRKSKGEMSKSTSSVDSARPQGKDSKTLRDRYHRLKESEKKHNGNGKELDVSYSSRPPISRFKPSYSHNATYDENSDNGFNVSKRSQNNDSLPSMDSLRSDNRYSRDRQDQPETQHTIERRQQTCGASSPDQLTSKSSLRHGRPQSVAYPTRKSRALDSAETYAAIGHESSGSMEPEAKSISRRLRKSENAESVNERRNLTTTALNKLKELDSHIEVIESKKKASDHELKLMEKTIEGHRISLLKLEEKLRENQAKADDARTELMVLEFKKEQCKKELDSTTKELDSAQAKINDAEELGMSYEDIVGLVQERDELRARFRRGEASKTTIAERQELERALHTAREELFRERKYKREQLEELEEKLEETEHNFETMEEEKKLEILRLKEMVQILEKNQNEKTASSKVESRSDDFECEKKVLLEKLETLSNQLQEKDKEIVSLATESNRSREENLKLKEKISEIEFKVTEQITLREKLIAEAEKNANTLRKEKEFAIASVKGEKQGEIEKMLHDIEREKSRAILDSKSEHQEEICKMRSVIENKDREIEKLRERLHQEDDAKRELTNKLRMEAQEQIRNVLEKERVDWEREKEVSNQREDNIKKANFEKEKAQLSSEVEEAKNKCKIATEQISRLRTEIEDLRLENRKQLQDKLDAVSHARDQERKDQAKKYEQLKSELSELNEAELTNHRNKYSKLEEQLRNAKQEKHDALLKCKEADCQAERSERCFIAEIHDECQKMADLIRGIRTPSQSRNRSSAIASRSGSHLSRSNRPANSERCVSELRTLSDDVRATLRDLTTEVETHRRAAQIAQRERNQAISSGSNSSAKQLSQQIAELNGHNSQDIRTLSKQLADKDDELRDIQRSMSLWKDTTAQKLADKFEEELAVQLERKLARHRFEHKRQLERLEEEIAKVSANNVRHSTMHPDFDASVSLMTPISSTPAKIAPQGADASDKGTVKLLRHLQGRVKQLRAENDLLRSNSQILDYDGLRKSR